MRRREFIALSSATLLASSLPVNSKQARLYRIGVLTFAAPTDNPPPPPAYWNAFVQGLQQAGYIENQNVFFEQRYAHHRPELFPELARDLVALKVDLIFARASWALYAARDATSSIPIVGIDGEIDPVDSGLVTSIARPGGNITGVFVDLSELSGKHLQLLEEFAPGTSRIAVLAAPLVNAAQLRELERLGKTQAVQIRPLEVKTPTDVSPAFEAAVGWGAQAAIVLSNPTTVASRVSIAELSKKANLPTIYLYRAHVEAGGLISYGPDLPHMFQKCGVYAARILGGAYPAQMPIERPVRFDLVVNLRTARAIGLSLPETILTRADDVIE
jgi:putative tryptophan/tyrosine transport system substrate-binding protein